PWLPTAFRQVTDPPVPPWRSFVAWPEALTETMTALAFGQSIPVDIAWPGLAIALVVLGIGLLAALAGYFSGRAMQLRCALLALGVIAVPFSVIAAATYYVPLYHVRYMFLYAVGYYVLLGLGFVWLGRRSLLLVVMLLGILVGTSFYSDLHRRND